MSARVVGESEAVARAPSVLPESRASQSACKCLSCKLSRKLQAARRGRGPPGGRCPALPLHARPPQPLWPAPRCPRPPCRPSCTPRRATPRHGAPHTPARRLTCSPRLPRRCLPGCCLQTRAGPRDLASLSFWTGGTERRQSTRSTASCSTAARSRRALGGLACRGWPAVAVAACPRRAAGLPAGEGLGCLWRWSLCPNRRRQPPRPTNATVTRPPTVVRRSA